MGDLLCMGLVALCTAVGAAHLCGWLWGLLLCPQRPQECLYLLPVHHNDQCIEYKLRQAVWTLHWTPLPCRGQLLLVDFSADAETLRICQAFLAEHDWAGLCTPDQLEEVLQGRVCKTLQGVLY